MTTPSTPNPPGAYSLRRSLAEAANAAADGTAVDARDLGPGRTPGAVPAPPAHRPITCAFRRAYGWAPRTAPEATAHRVLDSYARQGVDLDAAVRLDVLGRLDRDAQAAEIDAPLRPSLPVEVDPDLPRRPAGARGARLPETTVRPRDRTSPR